MTQYLSKLSINILIVFILSQISSVSGKCNNLAYFGTEVQESPSNAYCAIHTPTGEKFDKFTTCCGEDTRKKLHEWWFINKIDPNDATSITRHAQRQEDLNVIATYSVKIFQLIKEVKKKADLIMKHPNADDYCKDKATKVTAQVVKEQYIKDFIKESKVCWDWKNQVILDYFCAVCDPTFDQFYDITKKEVTVSERTCDIFLNMCFHTVY